MPSNSIDSPSLKGPTVVPSLMKVTVVATEVVELHVRLDDEDPGVNIRELIMLGLAAGRDIQCSVVTDGYYINLHSG